MTITSTTAHALSTVSQVLFGDTPAGNVAYDAGADHVTTPAGAGVVQVTVVLANGEVSNGVPFYCIPAPVEAPRAVILVMRVVRVPAVGGLGTALARVGRRCDAEAPS
ncbi:hypothetical protein [Kitasatospora sp. NPDC058190]|uniref:hypothetical protein n=1 Tax=Kitasatospora sp. NPDC058190 TaxID=3346371 RepID=UPI0036D93EB1